MNYLLTNPQKSIWLTEKVYSQTSINNISGYTYIDEDVEFDVLKKAINEVIKLNDSMRIKIKEDQDSCVQYFSEYTSFDIDIFELSSKQDIEKKALEAKKTLLSKTGKGRDFLGWVDLPISYDREELNRIKESAKKIRKNSKALVVIGIGGSYLGAGACEYFLSDIYKSKSAGKVLLSFLFSK